MPDTIKEVSPYVCKISGATFTKPCSVASCFANISNVNRSGVIIEPITNCVHADFYLHGFSESISYAVEEQGFVGYRDLQYISPFMQVNAIKLRSVYTENIELFRKAVALLWLMKSNPSEQSYCKKCGHPLKHDRFECTSSTICNERRLLALEVIKPIQSIIPTEELVVAFNILWRSLTEKFPIKIPLTNEEKDQLEEVQSCF